MKRIKDCFLILLKEWKLYSLWLQNYWRGRIVVFPFVREVPLMDQTVRNLPTMWETWVQSLCQEDPLEKEMATHSSILAWRIPWTEEPGRLQSMGWQTVGHDWATNTSLQTPYFFPLQCLTLPFTPQVPYSSHSPLSPGHLAAAAAAAKSLQSCPTLCDP